MTRPELVGGRFRYIGTSHKAGHRAHGFRAEGLAFGRVDKGGGTISISASRSVPGLQQRVRKGVRTAFTCGADASKGVLQSSLVDHTAMHSLKEVASLKQKLAMAQASVGCQL